MRVTRAVSNFGKRRVAVEVDDDNDAVSRFVIFSQMDDETEVEGTIRADGCLNWRSVGVNGHLCGPDEVDGLADALRGVWSLARLVMPEAEF